MAHTLEVYRRASEGALWMLLAVHRGNVKVHAEPFEAIELDLSLLLAELTYRGGSLMAFEAIEFDLSLLWAK